MLRSVPETCGHLNFSEKSWSEKILKEQKKKKKKRKEKKKNNNDETHKLLWDFEIKTGQQISARRPDLVIINKKQKNREPAELWILPFQQTTE